MPKLPPRKHLPALAAIALVTVACHLPALRAPFAWDDFETHVQNPHMERAHNLIRYFHLGYWRKTHATLASPYRPVREIILGGMRHLFGPDARAFHAVSLLGHTLNALLVYGVAWLLLRETSASLVSALIFALHPGHVEVVALTKNVGEIACAFFALLSVLAYLRWLRPGRTALGPRTTGSWALALVAVVCAALGLLTKESSLSVPLVLTVWAVLCLRGRARRWGLAGALPLWAMAGVYLAFQLTSKELTGRAEMAMWAAPSDLGARLLLVLKTVMSYLGILAVPVVHSPWRDFRITGDEPVWQHTAVVVSAVLLAAAWLWSAWRWRRGAVAIFWTVAAIGPASNIVVNASRPLAEQRLYFPSVGFALLAGALSLSLRTTPSRLRKQGLLWLCAAVYVVYGAVLWRGLNLWGSERSLWRHTLRASPRHCGPHCNLGNAYTKVGFYPSAAAQYAKVQITKPGHPDGLMNEGAVLSRMGKFDEALKVYREALAYFPGNAGLYNNMAGVCFRRSRLLREQGNGEEAHTWLLRAMEHYEHARKLKPDFPHVYANLGNCYLDLERHAEARKMFQKALDILPEFPEALYNFARLHLAQDNPSEAARLFRRAAQFNPNLSGVFVRIARAHESARQLPQAKQAWQEALRQARRMGDSALGVLESMVGLAQVQEMLGDRAGAHATWQRAARRAPGHPRIAEALRRTAPR